MKTIKIYTQTLVTFSLLLFACGQPSPTTVDNSTPATVTNTSVAPAPVIAEKPDSSLFEIITTNHNQAVQNFYVLYKPKKFDEKSLNEFVTKFRTAFCTTKCNIELYDTKSLKDIMTKYPVSNKEYLQLADHNIASSTFEMPEVYMYPLQDIKYKELGGHNWKKKHDY